MVLIHIGKKMFKIKSSSLRQVAHCLLHTFQILKHLQITKKIKEMKIHKYKNITQQISLFFNIYIFLMIFQS
jgi:hypothetical protein